LEVTESTAMQNTEVTLGILDQLADMGVLLAIDDFGTGYSSLAYLKHLPIQHLKIDRSFVTDIEADANDAAICAATIALGHNLGLKLIAEGVETEQQREFLSRLGCDILQGYLYSKPLPFDEIIPYLQAHQSLSEQPCATLPQSNAPAPDC
ncbi:MAG TPA: EAL domain-containing protein, partial [Azonexus sp.]|nr:EAL domain-containing protein [Azonexus sp.]